MEEEPPSSSPAPPRTSHRSRWILVGLLTGLVAGLALNWITEGKPSRQGLETAVREVIKPVGSVFLRLLFMTVLQLVFSSLALGVYGMGNLRTLGKIGARTLVLTLIFSGLSVGIGLLLVNTIRPGTQLEDSARKGFLDDAARGSPEVKTAPQGGPNLTAIINAVIPRNPVEAAARAFEGDMLAVLFFSLLFGVALRASGSPRAGAVVALLEGIRDVSFWLVGFALLLAPVGVACLVFSMASVLGLPILKALGGYVATVLLGLAIQLLVVYPLFLKFFCGVSPRLFLSRIREVLVTAFSTSSSNATLPTTLRVSRERLGIDARIGDFVLTLGSTFNQNGTALFEGVTILFLAQFFEVHLSLGQQALVVILSILAGVGTAGVPGGSIPLIVPVLVSVGVPAEGILVIIGVDRFLDMCRTALNVAGDLVLATYVARREGGLQIPVEETGGG